MKEIYGYGKFISGKAARLCRKIRESYGEHTESDLEKLRKLDEKVKRPADIFAYTFGVVGAFVLGVGMCIAMGTIGAESLFPLGVVVGVIGIAAVVTNYFIYRAILKSRKKKYSAEVIALSDKILGQQK